MQVYNCILRGMKSPRWENHLHSIQIVGSLKITLCVCVCVWGRGKGGGGGGGGGGQANFVSVNSCEQMYNKDLGLQGSVH